MIPFVGIVVSVVALAIQIRFLVPELRRAFRERTPQ